MEEGAVWTVPRPSMGLARCKFDIYARNSLGSEQAGHGLASQRLWSIPCSLCYKGSDVYGVFAVARGAWGVLYSIYIMMSYEVSE